MKNRSTVVGWSVALALGLSVASCHAVIPLQRAMSRPSTEQSVQRGLGSLTIHVTLPRQTQALTSNTQSLQILLRNTSLLSSDITQTVNGSGAQTLVVSALPPGSGYTLYAGAYGGLNATGTLMSWGQVPLTIVSGTNNVSLGLSVRVGAGSAADSQTGGPAGSNTQVGSTQWVQTTIADFTPGTTANTELFVPGLNNALTSLGTAGSANGQFGGYVEDIAFDRSGNLYACDRANKRIEVFDSSFNFVRAWGNGTSWTPPTPAPVPATGSANGYFSDPTGLAIDAQGNVYVTDGSNQQVQKFDSNGNFLMGWGNGTTWTGAAPAPTSGSANGYFSSPHQPAVDRDNNVYVSDYANARIQKFSPNGVFLMGIGNGTTWTGAAPAPVASDSAGYFNSPRGKAFDSQGNLYVGDQSNSRVQKFSPTGTYLGQWGGAGSQDNQFANGASSVGVDPFGRIWAGGNNNSLQVFTPNGQFLSRVAAPASFTGVLGFAIDPAGNMYATDTTTKAISRFQGASPTDVNGGIRLVGYRANTTPSNFVSSGTYVSPVLDAQSTVNWGSLYWVVSNLPAGTGVAMGVATSSDTVTWSATQSVAASSVAGNNIASLSATSFNSRFLRYQLTLTTSSAATTSEVQEVGVIY